MIDTPNADEFNFEDFPDLPAATSFEESRPGSDRYEAMFGEESTHPEIAIHRAAIARIATKREKAELCQAVEAEQTSQTGSKTKPGESEPKPWTEEQEYALELVLGGMAVTEAALNAGVSRRTVHRWMEGERFQTEMAAREREIARDLQKELPSLLNDAFKALDASLRKDTPFAAIGVLKSLGVLDGTPLFESEDDLLQEVAKVPAGEATPEADSGGQERDDGKPTDETTEPELKTMGHLRHEQPTTGEPSTDEQPEADEAERPESAEAERSASEATRLESDAATRPESEATASPEQEATARREVARKLGEAMGHLRHSDGLNHEEDATLSDVQAGYSLFEIMNLDPASLAEWRKTLGKTAFQTGLQTARRQLQAYWQFRARHLAKLAAACIRRELQAGNGRVALAVLKGLGVMKK